LAEGGGVIHRWMLGRYLQSIALLQLALYVLIAVDGGLVLLYADPRLALVPFTEWLLHPPHGYPLTVSWVSAIVVLSLGEAVVRSGIGLRIYALVEIAYVLLFTAFCVMFVPLLLRRHALSAAGLLPPFGVFTAASAAPLFVALRLWRAPD
jgi:hypothetical protein